jgi:hypothetical protein
MKRFIDLGHQCGVDETWPREFAWWDTCVDSFEVHSGTQSWANWREFAEDFEGLDLERYKSLTPEWAFLAKGWEGEEP